MRTHGPERPAGQGLDPAQVESGNQAILALLCDPEVCDQVDLVITHRDDAYEVWSRRGLVRFQRAVDDEGTLVYPIVEVRGTNPIENQAVSVLADVAAERAAASATGHEADPPECRFIGPDAQSYPFAYERIAQLFDSPHAPDLVVSPCDWTFGLQAGQHGALHVRQARAPLWFSGPGVRPGTHELGVRAIDIAPTVLAALGFPRIDGRDASGRRAAERGVEPDVYLRRQDGRVLDEILDGDATPRRAYLFLLDGLHMTELDDRLERDPGALPNLRRLRENAAVLRYGSTVNFPSITWPSHTSIGTGTWCGHHDVVNPSYWLRDRGEMVSPQGQQVRTEGFSSPDVESIYEAFRRVRGDEAYTMAIHAPFGRGADHAVLEGRNPGHRERLKALTRELAVDEDARWNEDEADSSARESHLDTRGIAQVLEWLERPERPVPDFVYHELALTDGVGHDYGPHSEGLAAALDESDRRIGRVLDALAERGALEDTLFVLTADHGMAPQDVSLRANPSRHVEKIGLAVEVAEPMIWLRDLDVDVERAGDRRTARVVVRENDLDPSGERPEVVGASVEVEVVRPGAEPQLLCRGSSGPGGVFGFATPADLDSDELRVVVRAEGRNARHLALDGTPLATDLRGALYGRVGGSS